MALELQTQAQIDALNADARLITDIIAAISAELPQLLEDHGGTDGLFGALESAFMLVDESVSLYDEEEVAEDDEFNAVGKENPTISDAILLLLDPDEEQSVEDISAQVIDKVFDVAVGYQQLLTVATDEDTESAALSVLVDALRGVFYALLSEDDQINAVAESYAQLVIAAAAETDARMSLSTLLGYANSGLVNGTLYGEGDDDDDDTEGADVEELDDGALQD